MQKIGLSSSRVGVNAVSTSFGFVGRSACRAASSLLTSNSRRSGLDNSYSIGKMNQYPQTLARTQIVRNFGVTDGFMNAVSGKMEKRKEEQFGVMLKQMADAPKWTLRNWKVTMDTQLDSWTQYIPGVGSSDEMVELKAFKAMLDAMTPKELDNPELIKHPQKERIARTCGKPVDQVQKLMHYYSQSCIIAEWLQVKKKANEKLPESEVELNEMQSKDARMKAIAQRVMKGNMRRTGRGRRAFF